MFLCLETGDYRTAAMKARTLWKEWDTWKEQIRQNAEAKTDPQREEYRFFKDIPRSHLLTRSVWKDLVSFLPKEVAFHTPSLLYTSSEDGYRLIHLLHHAKAYKPTLLLMELNDSLLGVYREDAWLNQSNGFGESSTMLFSRDNATQTVKWWRGVPTPEGEPRFVYIRSTEEYILIGAGGKEGISLYISSDFLKSYSQKSEVFGNEPLYKEEFFRILNLELFEVLDVYYTYQDILLRFTNKQSLLCSQTT